MANYLYWIMSGLLLLATTGTPLSAQTLSVLVDLSMVNGIELTPKNVYNYRIVNNAAEMKEVVVTGTLKYRNSTLRANYTFNTQLYPGNNQFSEANVMNPTWQFSDNSLKELFFNYGKLPQGTYEYCVSIRLKKVFAENPDVDPINDCIYQTVNDIFLINLLEPEDNAKIYEKNPMLSWVVNYPFASALTYKVRVAELKKGQNNISAITRNNPVFQESNVAPTNIVYPVTARPLQVFQPYVWTVDAYYKGILLGGAETWRFTIIEDSLLVPVDVNDSYYDFEQHIGETRVAAPGSLRLKYNSDRMVDTMDVQVFNNKNEEVSIQDHRIALKSGFNYIDIVFFERANLKHNKNYTFRIRVNDKTFDIPFVYQNPLYLKK